MLIDNLKLNELKKHFKNEEDALKQAILNHLNSEKNAQFNMYGTRRFLYVEKIEEMKENYYRTKIVYVDYLISGPMEDTGIYYINEEVL